MKRFIKCEHCGASDFDVDICVVPRAVELTCNNCGTVTPIAYFTSDYKACAINTDFDYQCYEETFCCSLSEKDILKLKKDYEVKKNET